MKSGTLDTDADAGASVPLDAGINPAVGWDTGNLDRVVAIGPEGTEDSRRRSLVKSGALDTGADAGGSAPLEAGTNPAHGWEVWVGSIGPKGTEDTRPTTLVKSGALDTGADAVGVVLLETGTYPAHGGDAGKPGWVESIGLEGTEDTS